jgi:glucose-6-phosphate 1-dehydrogenase
MTETFVAAKLYVDNWRWADTPFYVAPGKRLARRETTIAIQFKRAPHPPFETRREEGCARTCCSSTSSRRGRLARDRREGARPGDDDAHGAHGLSLRRRLPHRAPEAYERLLLDCFLGDATLFTRADEVEEQWSLVDTIVAPGSATGRPSRTTRPERGGPRPRTS